jgi:polar amino acid transport system substrate-binding protein
VIRTIFLSCLLLLAISGLASGSAPFNSEPVVILYHDDTGTTQVDDVSSQPRENRIVFHMLNVVLPNRYGINIKMMPVKWSRGLELIKAGFVDGMINASYNDERSAYAVYPMKTGKPDSTKTLRLAIYSLYKNKNSTITWDGLKFDGIDADIVSINSYAIVDDLRKMGIAVKEESNTAWIIRCLAIGKVKSAALQSYVADEFLADNPSLIENIIKVETPLKKKEYYLIFSKKFYHEHEELALAIWDAIEDYKLTDEYRKMKDEFEK